MTKDKKSHSVGIHEISFCIAMLFVSVLTIVQPLLLKRLFDNLSNRDIIIQAIVFYGASIILLLFFEYIHKISAAKISQRVTRRIRDRMTSSFLEDRHIDVNADLVATLNVDLNANIKDFLESYYLNKLSTGVWFFSLLLYFAAIIYVDIAMAVLVVLTNVAVLLIPFITQKKTKILKNRLLLSLEAFNSKYFDVIRGINILKLTHAVLPQLKRIDRVSESNLSSQYTSDKYRNSVDVVIGAVSFAGTFSIILYGVIAITQQKLSIGAVFASIQFADLISLPLINLTSALHRLNGGKAIKERFDALYPPSHLPESVSKKLTSNTEAFEQLEMSNIAFSYSEDSEDVLRIDRLRIERGDKILLMGENGSGKSTLLKLLLKEIASHDGQIALNDDRYSNLTYSSLGHFITYVAQHNHVFKESVLDNICLKDVKDCPTSEIEDVLQQANAHHLRENTDATLLSGGEQQRVAFARALFHKKEVLIIDEGLSQVQSDVRLRMLKHILEDPDLTLIYVSHDINDFKLNFSRRIHCVNGVVEDS